MSDMVTDVEVLAETAWREFRSALADALEALDVEASLRVALDYGDATDGTTPYVRAVRDGDSIVVQVSSNKVLTSVWRLAKPGRRHLRELGLIPPTATTPDYSATYPRRHVDEAASVAVSALRVAFSVVHPAFLTSNDFAWTAESCPSAPAEPQAGSGPIYPIDAEHLDLLIDQAVAPMIGHPPHRDADGDIPLMVGSAVVYVSSPDGGPVIRVFAEMVVGIRDVEAAAHEVGFLNIEVDGVKFVLRDDMVVASADVPAVPFVAEHLQMRIMQMCDVVSSGDVDLARRVGGRVFVDTSETATVDAEEDELDTDYDVYEDGSEPEGHEDDAGDEDESPGGINPVMLCLLHLDAEIPGSMRPKVAAKVCGYDPDLIMELIQWNEGQELAWREARDEAYAAQDYDGADACEHERAHADRTVTVLRKALRRVLLRA